MSLNKRAIAINSLHIMNDGFRASLMIFLPFIAKDLMITMTKVGFLGTAMNMLEIFLAIPAAAIAAKIGGFRLLILTILFYALGFFLTSISTSYVMVVAAFIIAGISFGMFHPVAFSVVSRMFEKGERGQQLGNFTALGDLGRVGIASITTFIITLIGWRSTAFLSAVCIAIFFGIFFIIFRLRNQQHNTDEKKRSESTPLRYRHLFQNKKFILATSSFIFDSLASSSLFVFIPFLLLARGVEPAFLGILTSTFFIGNMFGKVVLGRLVDKLGNVNVFIVSELSMAVCIILLASSYAIPLIIVSSVILGIFTKGTVPVLTTMVTESVEHHGRFEKAFSLNAVFVGIGSSIAPLLLGYLSDTYGIVQAFYASALFALVAIIPAYLFSQVRK